MVPMIIVDATQSVVPGQLAIPSKWCRVTAVATTVTGAMR